MALTAPDSVLDFYSTPARMSAGGRHASLLAALPADLPLLVQSVQGLVLHEFTAWAHHGIELTPDRRVESHIREVEQMLSRLLELDPRPLHLARLPRQRLVGVCRHFALLLVAMLRAHRISARARWGFGTYFNPPFLEDHVLCEVWRPASSEWVLVDPQLDEPWQAHPLVDFDNADVPRDRFLIASEAWSRCRGGLADADRFGIFEGNLRGLWFVAGSLLKDVAALVKTETLAWDVWGAMPKPGQTINPGQLDFFDRLAALTRTPDRTLDELRALFATDSRLGVPAVVFNAVHGVAEPFWAATGGGNDR